MAQTLDPQIYVRNIRSSGLTIYDPIKVDDPNLWIPNSALESLLNASLPGLSFTGLAPKSRSKVVKTAICKALGYPVPASFTATKEHFPGQNFHTYAQKNDNLQVWNYGIAPARRYVIARVSKDDVAQKIKVITGDELSRMSRTGTLTNKFQARLVCKDKDAELISAIDTTMLRSAVNPGAVVSGLSPTDNPKEKGLLPISTLFTRLQSLIGVCFSDSGQDQDRLRGEKLQRLVCEKLGYSTFADNGQFPDVLNQLLEIKLQTAQTIDLGRFLPNSQDPLGVPRLAGKQVRPCDVRYALFYASRNSGIVTITHFFLTTGEQFFLRFPQCLGNELNSKLQITLSPDFFDD